MFRLGALFRLCVRLLRGFIRFMIWTAILFSVFLGGLWAVRAVSDRGAAAQFAVVERHCRATFTETVTNTLAARPGLQAALQAAQTPICAAELRRPWTIFAAFSDSPFVREDLTVRVSQNVATVYKTNDFACFMGPAKCRAAPISSEVVLTASQLR